MLTLTVVILLVGLGAGLAAPRLTAERVDVGGRLAGTTESTGTVRTRLMMWGIALRGIADRPVFGWGPNNFRFAAQQHATAERLEAEPLTRDGDAHDLPLEIAVTWGVPGALLLAAWFAATGIGLAGVGGSRPERSALGLGVLGGFLISALTMPQNVAVTPLALLLLALAAPASEAGEGPASGPRVPGRVVEGLRLAAFTAALIAAPLAVVGGIQAYRADARYLEGEIARLRGAEGAQAIKALSAAARTVPVVEYYWLGLGRAEARYGFGEGQPVFVDQAVQSFRKALALTPRDSDVLTSLTGVYMQRGDWSSAKATAEQAVAFAPVEPQPRVNLGYALVRLGRVSEGLAQVEQGLSVEIGSARVLYTAGLAYREAGDTARARWLFERALDLDPTFTAARSALQSLGPS
ncbi:MAG: hypothetical protein Kow00122_14380 [Thermoleophilia bacterium]